MLTKSRISLVSFILVGYIIGVITGYSHLKNLTKTVDVCTEYDRIDYNWSKCIKGYPIKVSREKEAFYTYGLVGAFFGAWASVFYITYIIKE